MGDSEIDIRVFGAAFTEFVERMSEVAQGRESPVIARVRQHLGADPRELPSISAEFSPTDRPNLQLALDVVLSDSDVIGISAMHPGIMMMGLSGLLGGHGMVGGVDLGPVQYADVEVGDGRVVRCVSQ